MEQFEHVSGVDAGCAHHQKHPAHHSSSEGYFGVVGLEIDPVLQADGSEEIVVSHPAQNYEACSRDGADPEDDKLGVVLGYSTDGVAGERRVVVQVLRDPVDRNQAYYGADASYFVEQEGRKSSLEHQIDY